MINSIIEFFTDMYHTPAGLWAITLYWIPMLVCLIGYLFEFVRDYKKDLENYEQKYYNPTLTVGSILGRLIVSVIPMCNLGLAIFRHAGKIIKNIVQACADFLDIPIIRHRPKAENQ